MKFLLTFVLVFIFSAINAQPFKKSYFISNDGIRTECLIKRADWTYNPSKFEYKLVEADSLLTTATVADILEFEIYNYVAYKRFTLKVERSSIETRDLTTNRQPPWKEETLFLKILVKGNARLYRLTDTNITKYFFETEETPIQQLLFYRFIGMRNNATIPGYQDAAYELNGFRQQLTDHLICSKPTANDFNYINYKRESLVKIFSKYNNCMTDGTSKNINTN